MGTKKFGIKTFESFTTPVIEFEKKVYDHDGNALPITLGKEEPTVRGFNSFSIDIHEIEEDEENKKPIREVTDSITVELIPDWVNKTGFDDTVNDFLNKGEKADEILALAIRLVCPRINYVVESKRVSLKAITERKPIKFSDIDLNDVIGKVEVQSELIRIKNSNPTNSQIAFSNLTVLSRNRNVAFYIDEVEDVGGNALPIMPGDTGNKMFVMKNLNPLGVEPPTLVYHKKFKNFFNSGDDYETVQCIMLLIGLPYCEQLLKWIIFGKPDYGKEEHQVIIKLIGELCDSREKDLEEITNEADDSKRAQAYLKLSSLQFENVQGMGRGWKKMLRQIVENEKK